MDKVNYNYREQIFAKQDKTRVRENPRTNVSVKHRPDKYLKDFHYNEIARRKSQKRIKNALSCAESEYKKGVRETSNNDSKDIRKYKFGSENNWDWCAFFANYCYGIGQNDERNLFGISNDKVGRTQLIKEKAKLYGYFEESNKGYTPKEGDLAVWTTKKNQFQGHIGIVSKVYEDGSYDVIEGNKNNKVSKIHYKSQKPKDADLKTKYFAGFVRMEDYLYDIEVSKLTGALAYEDDTKDLYEKDDDSTIEYMS